VVRYDLRDCGGSTTVDPELPGYTLRDLAADHDAGAMDALFSRPMPDWSDRAAVTAYAADDSHPTYTTRLRRSAGPDTAQ